MDYETMNQKMFELSESEKSYLHGDSFDGWKNVPTQKLDKHTVYRLPDLDYNLPSHSKHDEIYSLIGSHNLLLKRNSRFNEVPEHVHSYIELNYVYSGNCPQTIHGKEITLTKNQVLLIDTDCPHSISYLSENDIMISLMISKEFLKDHLFGQFSKESILSRFFINAITEKTDHDHYLLFHSENDRRISLFFQEFLCECFDPSINSKDILHHLFYVIIAQLINIYENDMSQDQTSDSQTYASSIIRYIEDHYKTCTQQSVSEHFHISPNYVSRVLKKHMGFTYMQLVHEKRLTVAAQLLTHSSLSVTSIANEIGYENVSFFYKKFYQKYHCTPKEYKLKKTL